MAFVCDLDSISQVCASDELKNLNRNLTNELAFA